jgi:hypothetical protein
MSTIDSSPWIKATASDGANNCVEMRHHGVVVEVRDTKAMGSGPVLRVVPSAFAAWLDGAKNGDFDVLS